MYRRAPDSLKKLPVPLMGPSRLYNPVLAARSGLRERRSRIEEA